MSAAVLARPWDYDNLVARVDFSKFPKVEGAFRQSSNAVSASFSLPKKDESTVKQSIALMDAFLTGQDWEPSPAGGGVPWSADGGAVFYDKTGLRMLVTVGVSRGSGPGASDVNAGLFLVGDVDVRRLPMLPGSRDKSGDFSSVRFFSPGDILGVRKFYQEQLTKQGWAEYRLPLPPGYTPSDEDLLRMQNFVQNGTSLGFRYTAKGAETAVSASVEMLKANVPIPPRADLLKLQDSPLLMSCLVKMTPEEAQAWCQEALGSEWTSAPVPPTEENTICHRFTRAGKPPLLLECLKGDRDTVVRIREVTR